MTAYIVAFVSRQIPVLLVDPMKASLGIGDVEVSLLYGLSFAALVGAAGVPAGLLVDRGHRVTIAAGGMVLWSVMTVASAFADSFALLLLCRALIGCGQAALMPAAHSLIADRVPPRRLGLALGLFGIAPFLGTGIAYLVGAGVVALVDRTPLFSQVLGLEPWRAAFLLVGLPGLPMALWLMALPDGRRRDAGRGDIAGLAALADFFRRYGRGYFLLKLATAFASMATYAVIGWFPTLLQRRFHWDASEAGVALGLLTMAAGVIGSVGGGMLADRAAVGDSAGRLRVIALAALVAAPFALAASLAAAAWLGLALLATAMLCASAVVGINPSATMAMMPPAMRGVGSGLGVLIVNLLGFGLGPTLVAMDTEYGWGDPARLHYSLASALPVMLLASAACAFGAVRPYGRSVTARSALLAVSA